MVKAFFWGFTKEISPAIRILKEEGICEVAVWVGVEPECDFQRKDFMDYSRFKYDAPIMTDYAVYDAVFKDYYRYLDHINTYNRYNEHNIYEYLNLFNRQINFFYHQLVSRQVDMVVLMRLPHYGPDTILYLLAKALGIRTVVLHPSGFPDRFFYVYNLEDFGYFNDIPEELPYADVRLEKKFEKVIPYMRGLKQYQYSLKDACGDFLKGRLTAFQKYANFRKFQSRMQQMLETGVDFDRKFIYFPLHFQPELSTSAIGGIYVDQLLALERLSAMLPDDWLIYIKEHLIQSEFMRDELFYDRLRALKKVKLLPSGISTYELSRNAQFVATVTGTAGWEAITGGKNVLAFGQPWYLSLPGVFRFDENFCLEEILRYRIDHSELERAVARLQSKMGKGIIAFEYFDVENFDKEANGRNLAEFIRKVIRHSFPSPVAAAG